jgi:hypothetical protein
LTKIPVIESKDMDREVFIAIVEMSTTPLELIAEMFVWFNVTGDDILTEGTGSGID